MSVVFDISINKQQINSITNKIRNSIKKKAPLIAFGFINKIGELPSVQRFINFLKTPQFFADFGIDPLEGLKLAGRFNDVFFKASTVLNNAVIKESSGILEFKLLRQSYLREITEHVWEPTSFSTSSKPPVLVNAWDIYEYGIIGGGKTSGVIKGYRSIEPKSSIQEKLSRSRLALMVKNKNYSFRFHTGNSPKINNIRSSIASNVDRMEKQVARIIKTFSRTGI